MPKRTVYTPEAFELEVAKFAEAVGVKLGDALTKTGIQVHDALSSETPRKTGRASASWNFTVDKTDPGVQPEGEYPAGAAAQRRQVPAKLGDNAVIYITNNLPYILPLAHGHSQQASDGWVERIVYRFNAYMQRAVAEAKPEL